MKSFRDQKTAIVMDSLTEIYDDYFHMLHLLQDFINGKDTVEEIYRFQKVIIKKQVNFDQENLVVVLSKKKKKKILRLLLISMRVFSDIERSCDRMIEIINLILPIQDYPALPELLEPFFQHIFIMLERLNKYVQEENSKELLKVIQYDNVIDQLRTENHEKISEDMLSGKLNIDIGVNLILILSSIERIGDRLVNMAEDFYYIFTGDDIRYNQ
ncbi:MAG: hypothetical protein MJB14_09230 [Spirochaetes bacterium]|nr:hypothetical protein [Spirochaetota bacterium]